MSAFEWKEKLETLNANNFLRNFPTIWNFFRQQQEEGRRKQFHKTSWTIVQRQGKFISLLNSKWQATRCVYWDKCFFHPAERTFISFDIEFIVLSSLIQFNWIIFLPCLFSSRLFFSFFSHLYNSITYRRIKTLKEN